jgi:hypothetical protein
MVHNYEDMQSCENKIWMIWIAFERERPYNLEKLHLPLIVKSSPKSLVLLNSFIVSLSLLFQASIKLKQLRSSSILTNLHNTVLKGFYTNLHTSLQHPNENLWCVEFCLQNQLTWHILLTWQDDQNPVTRGRKGASCTTTLSTCETITKQYVAVSLNFRFVRNNMQACCTDILRSYMRVNNWQLWCTRALGEMTYSNFYTVLSAMQLKNCKHALTLGREPVSHPSLDSVLAQRTVSWVNCNWLISAWEGCMRCFSEWGHFPRLKSK